MSEHLYSFVLKTKQGEFGGLGRAGRLLRAISRPHFDVTKSVDEESLAAHLDDVASSIRKNWPLESDFYVDLFDVPLAWRLNDTRHPLRYLADSLQNGQLIPIRLIPTTGLEIERDAAYVRVAKDLAKEFGCGLCLRLKPEEIEHFDESTVLAQSLLTDYAGDYDVMLDFRSIVNQDVDRLAARGIRMIRALEEKGVAPREIIVCSSNIPEKLSDQVDKESRWNQPRMEFPLWEAIALALGRKGVVYGDYCVIFPEFFGPQRNKFINAKLRISDRNHYRLFRGHELYTKHGDPLQYKDLASDVLELEGMRSLKSRAIQDLQELASSRSQRKGSPASLVPTEICLHLDVTAEEVVNRVRTPATPLTTSR